MTGQVHAFACNRSHPQLGDKVLCTRQRFHAGDHRSDHDGRLREWSDPIVADLDPFEGLEATELKGHVHRGPMWWAYALLTVWILLIAPPVLVILYREAF